MNLEERAVPAADTFQLLQDTTLVVPAQATQVVHTADGEVTLPPTAGSEFFGTSLPADWQVTPWSAATGGTATVGGGFLTVDGSQAGPVATYGSPRTLEFVATFSGAPFQHVGFATDFSSGTPWMLFSTGSSNDTLYARTSDGTAAGTLDTPIPGSWLGSSHTFRIEWTATGATYFIDNNPTPVATHAIAIATPLRALVGDFGAGGGQVVVDSLSVIPPGSVTQFDGTSLPADWSSTASTLVAVGAGQLTVDGGLVANQTTYAAGRSLEFAATFASDAFQHVGFATDFLGTSPYAIFSTGGGGTVNARTFNGTTGVDTPLPGVTLNAAHTFRIDWAAGMVTYRVDGAVVAAHAVDINTTLRPVVSDFTFGGGNVSVDWMRMTPYGAAGTFLSRVFDAGSAVAWGMGVVATAVPANTTAAVMVRAGNSATPDGTWTTFLAGAVPGTYRYAQYRMDLATTDPEVAPTVGSVTLTAGAGSFTDTTTADFGAGTPGTGILADDGPALAGPFTAVLGTSPAHGTLALAADGSFTYVPAAGYTGADSFTYRARAADGTLSALKTITFDVVSPVGPPILTVASASGAEGTAIPLSISASPVGGGAQTLSIAIAGLPAGATLSHGTLAAGVWTLTVADLTGLTLTAADNATFNLAVTAIAQSIATGATASSSATLGVTVTNANPTATVNNPAAVTYGTAATVSFTNPTDVAADLTAGLHYAFALNAADLTSKTYANTTGTASTSYTLPAGSYTVHARVFDKDGGSTPYQFNVTVNKAPLTVTADNKSKMFGAAVPALTASYSGFVNGETPAALTTPVVLSTTATATSPVGTYPITASGATAANYSITFVAGTLTVTPASGSAVVAADPTKAGTNALFVTGTPGPDDILIGKADVGGSTAVLVHIGGVGGGWGDNFVFYGQYNRIVVRGLDGNDDIAAVGPSNVPTWIFGDDGNDRLLAGVDNSVLLGGAGNDLLVGSLGRDVMIGGTGSDRLLGGGGDDIIIGGTTAYDANEAALAGIVAVWVSNDSYNTRVTRLTSATFQYRLVQNVTVFNDSATDQATGGGGSDLFYLGALDTITDLSSSDRAFIALGA